MSTLTIEYGYANGSANTTRPTSVTYPDGRVINFDYGTAGDDDDLLGRIRQIKDGSTPLAEYTYFGSGQVLKTGYLPPATTLDFTFDGTGADPYGGCLDRFDRVIQNPWLQDDELIAGASYEYDRASNRTRMQPLGYTSTNDLQRYSYDGLQRLARSIRGGETSLTTQEAWRLDATGNWTAYDVTDVDDPTENLAQQRSANTANEITDIDRQYGADWPTPAYDRAGNTIEFPQSFAPDESYSAKYDAWNRLVEIKEGVTTVAGNAYDGLNRRVMQTTSGTTLHYYYSAKWQVLETRIASNSTADKQFVWGVRYLDDLICRIENAGTRYYDCQDGNWNSLALLNADGDVQQRYRYLAYGKPTRLNADGTIATESDSLLWEILHAGYWWDRYIDCYVVRNRWLHPGMGRWTSRDPLGYADGLNPYSYARTSPPNWTDPDGTVVVYFGTKENVNAIKKVIDDQIKNGSASLKALLTKLRDDPTKQCVITVVSGTAVQVGSWNTGEIDIDDIRRYPLTGPGSQTATIVHEVVEQWYKQARGYKSYALAHREAKLAEWHVTGWRQIQENLPVILPGGGSSITLRFDRLVELVDSMGNKSTNRDIIEQTLTFDRNGNVENVVSIPRQSTPHTGPLPPIENPLGTIPSNVPPLP